MVEEKYNNSEYDPDREPVVFKTIGAPGTGKTTRVVGNPEIPEAGPSLVQENLNRGYDFGDIFICTYTKAGTEEAADRLSRILDAPKYQIKDRVRTIHSACFQLMDMDREQVVQHWDKKNFCDKYDLEFGWDDDEDDIMGADKAEGNALFDLYGWLRNNCKDIEEWRDCPQDWPGDDDPLYLMEAWEQWKEENDKMDFSDMIHMTCDMARRQVQNLGWGVLFPDEDTTHEDDFKSARHDPERKPEVIRGKGAFLDTKVLFVDEVQDLNPLQWRWYLAQKLVCDRVYIGGDDDQTIYGWSGADPDFMLGEEGDFEVLDRTYRIPHDIWQTCDGVIRQVDHRQEKDVEPDGDGGEVVKMRQPSAKQVLKHAEEGSVFILFRARYMIDEFTDKLHKEGIPYDNMSTFDTWNKDVLKLRDAMAALRDHDRGEATTMSGDAMQAMLDYAEDWMLTDADPFDPTERAFGNFSGVEISRVKEMFDMSRTGRGNKELRWQDFLEACKEGEDLNYYQMKAIMGNVKKGREDMDPKRVKIGTIHSSKGKEAQTVILALDTTQTIAENMRQDTRDDPEKRISDPERRVYYVGMTRASEKLVLVEGLVDPEMTLTLNNLLGDQESEGEWQTSMQARGTRWK